VNRLAWPVAAALLIGATPSPSPSLDTILAAPPSGFTGLTTAFLHGHFTADDYAANADAAKRSGIVATLNRDGFVDGFSNTWVSQSSQHVLIEAVLAFKGGKGAHDWLIAVEEADKKDARFVRADTLSGLGTYYGAHLVDTASKTYGDEFSFVKGNDVFAVVVASTKDDALPQAMSQATSQFNAAPSETIPSSQWPENQPGAEPDWGKLSADVFVGLLVVGFVVFVVMNQVRARRRLAAASTATGGVQMSPDGNYWWDGQTWRDAAHEAPPFAQRSGDGALWWDGRAWRPIPHAPPTQ
jgi:hypothetical protein